MGFLDVITGGGGGGSPFDFFTGGSGSGGISESDLRDIIEDILTQVQEGIDGTQAGLEEMVDGAIEAIETSVNSVRTSTESFQSSLIQYQQAASDSLSDYISGLTISQQRAESFIEGVTDSFTEYVRGKIGNLEAAEVELATQVASNYMTTLGRDSELTSLMLLRTDQNFRAVRDEIEIATTAPIITPSNTGVILPILMMTSLVLASTLGVPAVISGLILGTTLKYGLEGPQNGANSVIGGPGLPSQMLSTHVSSKASGSTVATETVMADDVSGWADTIFELDWDGALTVPDMSNDRSWSYQHELFAGMLIDKLSQLTSIMNIDSGELDERFLPDSIS